MPVFLFKRDAIPGHPNQFDFTVDQPGAYGGQCAEFCGVYHDRMLLTVRAVTRPEYEAWLASQRRHRPARRARRPGSRDGVAGRATTVGSAHRSAPDAMSDTTLPEPAALPLALPHPRSAA